MAYTQEEFNDYIGSEIARPQGASFWKPAIGVGLPVTAFALGFARTKSGGRVWDVYFKALQHMEGALPMGIGATFRGSEIISPLASLKHFELLPTTHPELFKSSGFQDYLSRITGKRLSVLRDQGAFEKGIRWSRTGSFLGDLGVIGGPTLASNVGALSTGPRRQGHILEWFSRVSGVGNATFLKAIEETDTYLRPTLLPIAAQGSKLGLLGKHLYSVFSSGIGRMNLLLSSPFELPVMEDIAKAVPILNKIELGVKPGTGIQMMGRYAGKAALALGAYHAAKYVDYLGREYGPAVSIPGGAIFGGAAGVGIGLKLGKGGKYGLVGAAAGGVLGGLLGGPISGSAEVYAQGRVLQSRVSDTFGLGSGARRTEDFFPGMTEPTTLVASAGIGLLLGGISDYYERLKVTKAVGKQRGETWGRAHQKVRDIYEEAEGQIKEARRIQYESYGKLAEKEVGLAKLGAKIKQRLQGSMRGAKFSPSSRAGAGALIGAAVFTGLSILGSLLSGDVGGSLITTAAGAGAAVAYSKKGWTGAAVALAVPYLLREKTPPEELERIYSGEQEVPVKSGRFWEMGRCNTPESLMKVGPLERKPASSICAEDALIGSDGEKHKVLGVYESYYSGPVLYISTHLDRDLETGLTPNHIVPVIRASSRSHSYDPTVKRTTYKKKGELPVEETPAGDIHNGDFVQVPVQKLPNREQKVHLTEYIKTTAFVEENGFIYGTRLNWSTKKPQRCRGKEIPSYIPLSGEFGRLLGYFLAEGDLSYKDNVPQMLEFVFSSNEQNLVEDLQSICSKLFGLCPTVRKKTTGKRARKGCLIVRVCSAVLAKVFFGLFYRSSRDNDKEFPPICLEGNPSFREGVVEGYWLGDGHIDRDRRVISSGRRSFLLGVQTILLDLGFLPSMPKSEITFSPESGEPCGHKYRIGWRGNESRSTEGFQIVDGNLFVRVVSVREESYEGLVYDFEVDSKDHLLQNGAFLVHNSPYEGRRPYYRPHRIAMMRKGGIQESALYGSESAYWASDPVLSPLSWLSDPYAREKLMWQQGYRFPVTKTPFEDFPIIGPVLAATVGRAIKPPKFMGRDQWLPDPPTEGGVPEGWEGKPLPEPITRTGIKGTVGEQIYRITELMGLPGFVAQSIKGAVTGNESWFPEDQWATPSIVSGMEPGWWSLDMGGLALLSESIRRYIPHRRNEIDYRNPLPTGLPSWLPGPESQYFLDFSRADVYSKIKEPWARLPGEGYSQLHPELKGVNPEQYPDYWRFKILADLSPWSREYGQYDKMMSQMWANERLTAKQILDIQTTRRQVDETKKAKEFQEYRYDNQATRTETVRITGETAPGYYTTDTFGSAPISLAGISTSTASLANVAMRENASLTAKEAMAVGVRKRSSMARYLRDKLEPGTQVDIIVSRDRSALMERGPGDMPTVPAVISVGGQSLNRQLIEMGLAEERGDSGSLDPMAATGVVQRAAGAFWENLMHGAETPLESLTPMAPIAKFVHQRTPLEDYQRSEVYGRDVALWQKPVAHFLAPGFATTAMWAGWDGLPGDVKERYMVEEYFDRLEYMKWKRLENFSRSMGEGRAASTYAGRASRTSTGVDPTSTKSAYLSLAKYERVYFEHFVMSPTGAERREISKIVSPQFNAILHAQWAKREAEQAQMRAEAGVSRPEDSGLISRFSAMKSVGAQREREADISRAQGEMPTPGPEWVGWSPETDMADYKMKTVDSEGMDLARYGIWGSDLRKIARKPWVTPLSTAFVQSNREVLSPDGIRRRFRSNTATFGSGGPTVNAYADGTTDINITSPGRDRVGRYMRDPSILTF